MRVIRTLTALAVLGGCRPSPVDGGVAGETATDDGETTDPGTSSSGSSSTAPADTTDAMKLDAGIPGDDPLDHGCSPGPDEMPGSDDPEGGGPDLAFSNIWVASTDTVSVLKIDTRTMKARARYRTHARPDASPSRTSVNLNGDVAIANRGTGTDGVDGQSGVTVISTREETCVDRNGDGTIQTSSGPDDLLDWEADECMLWHRPFDARSNRPVAWTTGTWDAEACRWEDTFLWTATSDQPGRARVLLLDGDDGAIVGDVAIEGWITDDDRIVYGGAVDSHNDFWFIPPTGNQLGHVRFDDLSYEVIEGPDHADYGIFVDSSDRVLIANGSLARYDPATETWELGNCNCSQIGQRANGELWANSLVQIDDELLQPVTEQQVAKPAWGLSFDVDGNLMGVYFDRVQRLDVDTGNSVFYYPTENEFYYTYSDMTGWGLFNVADPEG